MTDPHLPDAHLNGGGTLIASPQPPESVGQKRQRRPSVRLGDIGDQTLDFPSNRKPKQWKGPRIRNPANYETLDRDSKAKTKRVRSNWTFSKGEDSDYYADEQEDEEKGHHSPVQSPENRVFKEFEPSDTDTRNWNPGRGGERNGIRVWLDELGLGRYAPVFEIHEVDDEVLPMLTLEDLKDMGINAVGSRRKLYCAIQKLSEGFS